MADWICKEVQTDNGGYFEPVRKITMCQDCWCWNEEEQHGCTHQSEVDCFCSWGCETEEECEL